MVGEYPPQGNIAIQTSVGEPADVVKTGQTNTYGAFAQIFPTSQLKIQNPAATFNYIIASAAILADRIITMPLLTANDNLVTEAFTQTLTNKTMAAGSNTITGIVDANISAHTTTKITTTSKSLLNTSIVYTDQSNTFGAFNQLFKDANLQIVASADATKIATFLLSGMTTGITLTLSSSQSTSQTLTIPNITAADTIDTLGLAQTFTAVKTFNTNSVWTAIADPTAAAGRIWLSSTNADVLKYSSASTIFNILSTKGAITTSTPADPAGTTSTTGVMMGLAGAITPLTSTRVLVTISGQISNNTVNDGVTVALRTGTGGAPTNGAALTGTVQGASQTFTALIAAQKDGFSISAIVTGLTIGTAIWIDASLAAITAGTATLTNTTITANEI